MFPPSGNSFRFDLLTRAWSYFQQRAGLWVSASFLAWGIEYGVVWLLWQFLYQDGPFWGLIVAIVAATVHRTLLAGLCRIALNQLRGEPVRLRDLFAPQAGFIPTLGIMAAATLSIQVAFSFSVIPGIILNTLLLLLEPILADRTIGLKAAFELSARTIQTELITVVCFSLALGWLGSVGGVFLGSYAALAGFLIYPLVPLSLSLLYRTFFPYTRYDRVE